MHPPDHLRYPQSTASSTTPPTRAVYQISAQSEPISHIYDRDKLASFPYFKFHQKFRIFASARSRLYRWIFRFFLHFRVEYAPISTQKLKISAASIKKCWKIFTQNTKNAMLTHFFNVEKNFRKKVFDSFCKISTRSQSLWRNFSKIRRYRRKQADTNFIKKSLFQNFSSHLLFEKLQKILKNFDCLAPPYQKRMGNFCMRPLGHPAFSTPVSALKNDQKVDQHEANTVVKQAGWPKFRPSGLFHPCVSFEKRSKRRSTRS